MMPILHFMGGSAADTPATPDFLRASDAERDHAVDELRQEFVDGRLSHDTFMFRMQSALGARHRGQLSGLFTDLPPRRARLLARIRAAFRRRDRNATDPAAEWSRDPPAMQAPPEPHAARGAAGAGGWPPWYQGPQPLPGLAPPGPMGMAGPGPVGPVGPAGSIGPHASGDPVVPAPMVFPPGNGTSFTIGRTQDCDLRIADMSVSRLHAQLDRHQDGWLLSDLGSHNGTRVNGWLVREPVPVRPGDLLQFGSAVFVIQPDPPRQPPSPEPSDPSAVWPDEIPPDEI
jgi:Domain of unknown function (DUF1707)/FHA domain